MDNYKDNLRAMSKTELLESIRVDPDMAERCEVEYIGGTHLTKINGPDGVLDDGRHIEIKSQRFNGNFTLRGRGKFGAVSQQIYDTKIKENEIVIVTGYDEGNGDVYYRFQLDFDAIAEDYQRVVNTSIDKQWGNYDMLPPHYANHNSFNVNYIAKQEHLDNNKYKFQNKFYKFLTYLNDNNYTQPTAFYEDLV